MQNANSQHASCVLVCEFVCVQSLPYPHGLPQKTTGQLLALCDTSFCLYIIFGNPGTELQAITDSRVLLQGYLESGEQGM